jgi:multidrug resistance protein, MATE family
MLVLDWWIWEFMVLISGYLGVNEQAATIVVMNVVVLAYMFAVGFETAACALIGQQIGKGDVEKAKLYYNSIILITSIMLVHVAVGMYFFKEKIIGIFTTDPELSRLALSVIWLLSISSFPDGFKGMQKGVVRALGIQYVAVYINIAGHWCINLTLQYLLAFYFGLGMLGMWISKCVLEIFIFLSYSTIIWKADWDKIAEKASERSIKM